MNCRRASGAMLVGVALLLHGGCAVSPPPTVEIAPKPSLFPRGPTVAADETPGRVALWMAPDARASWSPLLLPWVRLQTGSMVEQALLLTLGDGLQGGALVVTALPPAGAGFGATVVLQSVHVEFQTEWPAVSSVWLAFDLKVLNPQGRTAWTRNYSENTSFPLSVRMFQIRPGETVGDTEKRLAHEAAWRLSQQVLRDLREWLAAERMKLREM